MAKKQSRRSVSLSRGAYERLKAYCETNAVSMSQFVEERLSDFLGAKPAAARPLKSAPVRGAKPEAEPAPAKKAQPEKPAAEPRRTGDHIFTF
jgi:hypothetical protein